MSYIALYFHRLKVRVMVLCLTVSCLQMVPLLYLQIPMVIWWSMGMVLVLNMTRYVLILPFAGVVVKQCINGVNVTFHLA